MQHPIKQKAFLLTWENNQNKQVEVTNEFYTMRNWQIPAFETLKDANYMILNAPTGSGKSWMMCLLSAFKMQQNSSLKTIIAVPQTIIASGFLEAKIQMPTGEKIHWKIKNNLCEKSPKGTVANLIEWLQKKNIHSLEDRTVICTHATLIHLHKRLKETNQLELLNDLLIFIDEAHHVKNIESENIGIINNGLGALVSHLINKESNGTQLGLTTASFYRGDRCSLLTQDMELKFKRFNLPYDQYLTSMKHLKSFSVDFLLCGPQYHKAIELLIKDRKAKDIIYIPHPVSGYSSGNKKQEVNQIIESYGKIDQNIISPIITAKGSQHSYKILDLVDENLRKEKKDFLRDPILKKDREALDVIIALGMFKEGADWIYADRSIIVGARSSLVDMIQMIGRLFRDARGKEHVEVFQLLPFSLDQQNEKEFSQNLNDYLKAIFASLILENIFNPVKIKLQQSSKNKDKNQNSIHDKSEANWLSQAIPDEVKQQSLIEDIMNQLVEIKASNQEKFSEVSSLKEEYDKAIPQFLKTKYGITEYTKEIANQVWNIFARKTLVTNGMPVENIFFDLLQKTDPLEFLLRYTSNACNINTFDRFREALQLSRSQWRPFKEARIYARSKKLKTYKEWIKISKLDNFPSDIPKAPDQVYKEWTTWGDFLGNNNFKGNQWLSFNDARNLIKNLKLKNITEYKNYINGEIPHLPSYAHQIPKAPDIVYSKTKEWTNWGDWLGTDRIASQNYQYCSYEEAREFAINKKLKTNKEWRLLAKSINFPSNIPKNPDRTYKNKGWTNWNYFLGTSDLKEKKWLSFSDCRIFIRSLNLKSETDYRNYLKKLRPDLPSLPYNIPKTPWSVYPNEWKGIANYLGISDHN